MSCIWMCMSCTHPPALRPPLLHRATGHRRVSGDGGKGGGGEGGGGGGDDDEKSDERDGDDNVLVRCPFILLLSRLLRGG